MCGNSASLGTAPKKLTLRFTNFIYIHLMNTKDSFKNKSRWWPISGNEALDLIGWTSNVITNRPPNLHLFGILNIKRQSVNLSTQALLNHECEIDLFNYRTAGVQLGYVIKQIKDNIRYIRCIVRMKKFKSIKKILTLRLYLLF